MDLSVFEDSGAEVRVAKRTYEKLQPSQKQQLLIWFIIATNDFPRSGVSEGGGELEQFQSRVDKMLSRSAKSSFGSSPILFRFARMEDLQCSKPHSVRAPYLSSVESRAESQSCLQDGLWSWTKQKLSDFLVFRLSRGKFPRLLLCSFVDILFSASASRNDKLWRRRAKIGTF